MAASKNGNLGRVWSFGKAVGVDKGLAVGTDGREWECRALVGVEKGDEWDSSGIGVGACVVLGVY